MVPGGLSSGTCVGVQGYLRGVQGYIWRSLGAPEVILRGQRCLSGSMGSFVMSGSEKFSLHFGGLRVPFWGPQYISIIEYDLDSPNVLPAPSCTKTPTKYTSDQR